MSNYWAFQYRQTLARDLGHRCADCKKSFIQINDEIAIRRGGRTELRYHLKCFSGQADPRTQQGGSYQKYQGIIKQKAPEGRYNKMRTNNHF